MFQVTLRMTFGRSVGQSVSLAVEPFLGFLPRSLYMYYRFLGFFLTAVRYRVRGRHHDTPIDVRSACRRVRPVYGLKTRFLPVLTFSLLSLCEVRSDDRKETIISFYKKGTCYTHTIFKTRPMLSPLCPVGDARGFR